MNIEAYLQRLHYRGSLSPTAETLRALHIAHLRTVPFENLSIHRGEAIVLDDDALFKKIVDNRRGGFCYEANGLFAALLRALGFDVAMLSAGVAHPGGFSPPFDHMTLMVTLSQRWLADVGFGHSFVEPLLLDERSPQIQGTQVYKIIPEDSQLILQRLEGADWKAQYRFTLQPYEYADYAEMCLYHQTSPDSHFTRGRICSRATEAGRITLSDMRLITTSTGGDQEVREERVLASEEEVRSVLHEYFGIVLD